MKPVSTGAGSKMNVGRGSPSATHWTALCPPPRNSVPGGYPTERIAAADPEVSLD